MRLFRHADARGDRFEDAVRLALRAVLVSPNFLFLVERDRADADGPYRVSDHELASRLSYFLWSSMPDDELFDLADAGQAARARGPRGAGAADARRPEVAGPGRGLRRPVAPRRQPGRARRARPAALPRVHARAPRRDDRGGRSPSSTRSSARTGPSSTCSTPTTPTSTSAWPSTTASRA